MFNRFIFIHIFLSHYYNATQEYIPVTRNSRKKGKSSWMTSELKCKIKLSCRTGVKFNKNLDKKLGEIYTAQSPLFNQNNLRSQQVQATIPKMKPLMNK